MQAQPLDARQEPWTTRSFAMLVIVALVVPGGSLVLAWVLLRRFLGRAALRRIAQVLFLALGLQACATRIDLPADPALHFQVPDTPSAGERALTTADLRPGDILLTSMPGMVGASIELLTLAPVSHAAIYAGDGRIVEALRPAVRERTIDTVMVEESEALVLRYPGLTDAQAKRIVAYAKGRLGSGFNYVGVTLQTPFVLGRRACELPLVPGVVRDACLRGLGALNPLAASEERLFCSQLVLEAYRHAGVPLADADPTILTPADILHMREGDVPSFRIATPLRYVGHLKNTRAPLVAAQLRARGD
jgi:uncharacterized protein YycO